jgi:hypothetical protein
MKVLSTLIAIAAITAALTGCFIVDKTFEVVLGPDAETGAVTGTVTGTGGHNGSIFYKSISIDTDPNRVYVGDTRGGSTLDEVKTGDTVTISYKVANNGQRWITAITRKQE